MDLEEVVVVVDQMGLQVVLVATAALA